MKTTLPRPAPGAPWQVLALFLLVMGAVTGKGDDHLFVAKWNLAKGTYTWAMQGRGNVYDIVDAIAVAGHSVYLAGLYNGDGYLGKFRLPASNYNYGYVARLTDAGDSATVNWVQPITGSLGIQAKQLAVSGSSVYVSGIFINDVRVGTKRLTQPDNTPDVFIAKLTDTGPSATCQWVQQIASPVEADVTALAVADKQVYVAGSVLQTATFGSLWRYIPNNTGNAMYVAKLTDADTTASFTWVQLASGTGYGRARALAVRGPAVYLAGNFYQTTTFGSLPPLYSTTAAGDDEAFVVKLTDDGPNATFTWALAAGGEGYDAATTLAVAGNTVYVSGNNSNLAAFGNTVLFSRGDTDGFVAALADAGSSAHFAWALGVNGANAGMTTLNNTPAGLYVGGYFFESAQFGPQFLRRPNHNPTGFLALLAPGGPLATAQPGAALPLSLFPNPAHHSVAVALPPGFGAARPTFTLLDALGRVVRSVPTVAASAAASEQVDLNSLAPGMYVLRAASGDKVATSRLVVE